MNTNFHIFEIPLPTIEKPEPTKFLRVRMKFKGQEIVETSNFQSLNVFNFIADDVDVLLWEHVQDDGEVLTEGNSVNSMNQYFENLPI